MMFLNLFELIQPLLFCRSNAALGLFLSELRQAFLSALPGKLLPRFPLVRSQFLELFLPLFAFNLRRVISPLFEIWNMEFEI